MSICQAMKFWEHMLPAERFAAVEKMIQSFATESGFGKDLTVLREPPPIHPERAAAYDSRTDTIYLHPGNFTHGSTTTFEQIFETAAHEFAHHVRDEVDNKYEETRTGAGSEPMSAEAAKAAAIADGETGGYVRPVGEDGRLVEEPSRSMTPEERANEVRHQEDRAFATALLKAAKDACKKNPHGAESAIRSFLDNWLFQREMDDDDEPSGTKDWDLPAEMTDV